MEDNVNDVEDDDNYDNPYLFNSSGPRKKIDYSKLDTSVNNDEDYVMYDETSNEAQFSQNDHHEYKINHKNEKFALYPKGQQEILRQNDEERELSEALEKIREMEEKQKTFIDEEKQILDYLK